MIKNVQLSNAGFIMIINKNPDKRLKNTEIQQIIIMSESHLKSNTLRSDAVTTLQLQ